MNPPLHERAAAPLSPGAKKLLATLAAIADPDGECLVAIPDLAGRAGLSLRWAIVLLPRLVKLGLLTIVPSPGQVSLYRVHPRFAPGIPSPDPAGALAFAI